MHAVANACDAQGTFKQVTATFSVPTVRPPAPQTRGHAAAAWVGIDGYSCRNAILQAGVDFTIDAYGDPASYHGTSPLPS